MEEDTKQELINQRKEEIREKCDFTTEEEVEEFNKGMPRYKRPRKIIFAKVPRNATGKIEKPLLREMYNSVNLVDALNRS